MGIQKLGCIFYSLSKGSLFSCFSSLLLCLSCEYLDKLYRLSNFNPIPFLVGKTIQTACLNLCSFSNQRVRIQKFHGPVVRFISCMTCFTLREFEIGNSVLVGLCSIDYFCQHQDFFFLVFLCVRFFSQC